MTLMQFIRVPKNNMLSNMRTQTTVPCIAVYLPSTRQGGNLNDLSRLGPNHMVAHNLVIVCIHHDLAQGFWLVLGPQ